MFVDDFKLGFNAGGGIGQLNQDVDKDGTIDIALQGVCGYPPGALPEEVADFEFELSEASTGGGPYAVKETKTSPTGLVAFKANSTKYYKLRVRAISWQGAKGTFSALTAAVNPSGAIGAPAAPTGVGFLPLALGWNANWNVPPELDYAFSEIAVGNASTPISIIGTATSNQFIAYRPTIVTEYIWVRHANTSGLRSSWVRASSAVTTTGISNALLAAGAPGDMAVANHGTSGGSIDAGPGNVTLLSVTFKCTSNTAGVTVTLGSQSWTVDFKDQQPYTFATVEPGGGSFSVSKSGGGTWGSVTLSAVTLK